MTLNAPFYIKLYLATVPVFFLIDMVWLGFVARGFYKKHLDFILSAKVNWAAAIVFYLIFISGIILFAVQPALEKSSLGRAALLGGLFGFFTYATYDLTNLATIKDWPIAVVLVAILWGIVLCSLVASTSFMIANWLNARRKDFASTTFTRVPARSSQPAPSRHTRPQRPRPRAPGLPPRSRAGGRPDRWASGTDARRRMR